MPDEKDTREMYLKTYRHEGEVLIAVCDCEILGKKFSEGRLRMHVSPDFFGDERVSFSEVENALESATIANLVGCRCVEHAIRLGFVKKENILTIEGVLYAQMVRM